LSTSAYVSLQDFSMQITPNLGTSYGLPGQDLSFTTDQVSDWSNGGLAAPIVDTQTTCRATQDQWQGEAYGVLGKWDRSPGPDFEMAELDGFSSEGALDRRVGKKTRIALRGGMGDMTAQTGTPKGKNPKSKLGRCKVEVPAVKPAQRISNLYLLGPTVIQSASATPDCLGPAWDEGDGGLSGEMGSAGDTHGEEETDRQRQERLIRKVDGVWTCAGCNGKRFFDRCTLRRHCKSAAHSKGRDMRSCPYCPNKYLRQSSVDRHVRKHHSQNGAGEGAQDSSA
jgi:hypothetical protein